MITNYLIARRWLQLLTASSFNDRLREQRLIPIRENAARSGRKPQVSPKDYELRRKAPVTSTVFHRQTLANSFVGFQRHRLLLMGTIGKGYRENSIFDDSAGYPTYELPMHDLGKSGLILLSLPELCSDLKVSISEFNDFVSQDAFLMAIFIESFEVSNRHHGAELTVRPFPMTVEDVIAQPATDVTITP